MMIFYWFFMQSEVAAESSMFDDFTTPSISLAISLQMKSQ